MMAKNPENHIITHCQQVNITLNFAETRCVNFQKGVDSMTREAQRYVKGAAAGVITGGLTFLAVKSLSGRKRMKRRTAAKALKVLGSFMDSI